MSAGGETPKGTPASGTLLPLCGPWSNAQANETFYPSPSPGRSSVLTDKTTSRWRYLSTTHILSPHQMNYLSIVATRNRPDVISLSAYTVRK